MSDRVVLVTGAASGNGRAIASRFLDAGDRVVAVDLDEDALQATRTDVWQGKEDQLICWLGDVADVVSVAGMVAETVRRFGRLDVLINNAGITGGPAATCLHETPVDEFDRVMAVNVRGVFLLSREALPVMLEQGQGIIVNIASVAGLVAFPGRAAYTTSKGAVVQLTRSIAADYAARGIRCTALCPGFIETPMTSWRLAQPELRAAIESRIPQGEVGTVDDVASAVAFLASPQARYFNGAAIVMDGGWTVV